MGVGRWWECPHLPGSALCCLLPLTLSCLVHLLFRSYKACDEPVGHVIGSVLRNLVLLDEDYGVGAGVPAWHSLGKSAYLITVGVHPCCPRGVVCY